MGRLGTLNAKRWVKWRDTETGAYWAREAQTVIPVFSVVMGVFRSTLAINGGGWGVPGYMGCQQRLGCQAGWRWADIGRDKGI